VNPPHSEQPGLLKFDPFGFVAGMMSLFGANSFIHFALIFTAAFVTLYKG
jgi:hypothetical protein